MGNFLSTQSGMSAKGEALLGGRRSNGSPASGGGRSRGMSRRLDFSERQRYDDMVTEAFQFLEKFCAENAEVAQVPLAHPLEFSTEEIQAVPVTTLGRRGSLIGSPDKFLSAGGSVPGTSSPVNTNGRRGSLSPASVPALEGVMSQSRRRNSLSPAQLPPALDVLSPTGGTSSPKPFSGVSQDPIAQETVRRHGVFTLRAKEGVPGTFVSDQKDELDRPLLTFAEEAGVSLVRVSTLAALVNYIEGLDADQHRIERACVLKENRRWEWNICGASPPQGTLPPQRFSKALEVYRFQQGKKSDVPGSVEMRRCQLLQALDGLDGSLMTSVVKRFENVAPVVEQVTVPDIEREVVMLQSFATPDKNSSPLAGIDFESAIRFKDGIRAPPWRQDKGDLCYLMVSLHDAGNICLTCNREKIFQNGGNVTDEHGREKLDYTQVSTVEAKSVVDFLRKCSPHFATSINEHIQKYVPPSEHSSRGRGTFHESFGDLSEEESDEDPGMPFSPIGKPEFPSMRPSSSTKRADHPVDLLTVSSVDRIKKKRSPSIHSHGGLSQSSSGDMKSRTRRNRAYSQKWANLEPEQVLPPMEPELEKLVHEVAASPQSPQVRSTAAPQSLKLPAESQKLHEESREPSQSKTPRRARKMRKKLEEQSSDEDIDDELFKAFREESNEMSPDIAQINKLIKFLRGTNVAVINISLASLLAIDFSVPSNQLAVRNVGGLEPLLNLCCSELLKQRIYAIRILHKISSNAQIAIKLAELQAPEILLRCLVKRSTDLREITCYTLANLCKSAFNRRLLREKKGIRALCRQITPDADPKVVTAAATAVWQACTSRRNSHLAIEFDIISRLCRQLEVHSDNKNLCVACGGALMQLGRLEEARKMISENGGLEGVVRVLASGEGSQELNTVLAGILGACAEDKAVVVQIRKWKGIKPLVSFLSSGSSDLLIKATEALTHCAQSPACVKIMIECSAIQPLCSLLNHRDEDVSVNAAKCLANCCINDSGACTSTRNNGAVASLLRHLRSTYPPLLSASCKALGALGRDDGSFEQIRDGDGIRLIWSLLRSEFSQVQAYAAYALSSCLRKLEMAAEYGRSLVGGLPLLVRLLGSEDTDAQAYAAAAISMLAQDDSNVMVLTEEKVLPALAKLSTTSVDLVRKHLALAVANVCRLGTNAEDFGNMGAAVPLVEFLSSADRDVLKNTALALAALTEEETNSAELRSADAVTYLVDLLGSEEEEIQLAAARAIANIRRNHLDARERGLDLDNPFFMDFGVGVGPSDEHPLTPSSDWLEV